MSQRVVTPGMCHLNNHLLCAIDTETTGDKPGFHDIIQVAVIPLDANIKPFKDITPFYMDIQPKRPENYNPEAMRKNRTRITDAMLNGVEAYRAADLFDEWVKKLNLGFNKRIIPLAHNWPFDRGFLIDWLGHESVDQYFDGRHRDTMVIASFMNDLAEFRQNPHPYAKVELKYLATTLQVPIDRAHDALQDALGAANIYRKLIQKFL